MRCTVFVGKQDLRRFHSPNAMTLLSGMVVLVPSETVSAAPAEGVVVVTHQDLDEALAASTVVEQDGGSLFADMVEPSGALPVPVALASQ